MVSQTTLLLLRRHDLLQRNCGKGLTPTWNSLVFPCAHHPEAAGVTGTGKAVLRAQVQHS